MKNQKIEIYTFSTKIGNISIYYNDNEIIEIELNSKSSYNGCYTKRNLLISSNILEYLHGRVTKLSYDYTITGTDFERQILQYITTIPYGKTMSYKEVAKNCGYPKAYRAVGTVLRKNKLPLIIPCHRVIKSDGSLGEYNGGKDIKSILLNLEKNYSND